jgi:lipopolysaccharide/colanic/teichoic acid biosynthesis glycosyltransferase
MLRRNTHCTFVAPLAPFVIDWGVAVFAAALAGWLRLYLPLGQALTAEPSLRVLLLEVALLYPLAFLLFSLYDSKRILRAVDEYQLVSVASMVAGLVLAGLVYFTARELPRLTLLYFYGGHFVLVMLWRALAWRLRAPQRKSGKDKNETPAHRVLIIGGGEPAQRAIQRLDALAGEGVQLLGYLTDGEKIPTANGHIPHLGQLRDAESAITRFRINNVLLTLPETSNGGMQHLVERLSELPCQVWIAPDCFGQPLSGGSGTVRLSGSTELAEVSPKPSPTGSRVATALDSPVISLPLPALSDYQRAIKRAVDLVAGICLLILSLPLFALIALAIKLDSPGPVIFRQRRVGENGRLFGMYKFRSMCADAEQRLHEVLQQDENGHVNHKRANDPRVTRIGKILRRTSLDELPQLFNVLKGEMSLVGPRPEMPFLVEQYAPWQHQRLTVPQGITGWWQVNGRSDKPMHLNTQDDLYYVRNYSLLLDVLILMKTVWVVLRGKGAY